MNDQIWFQVYLTMIWISYVIAIYKNPGQPPKDFTPKQGEWKRWCKKCNNFKPERTHHCKTCNHCVLKMDHHCAWTNNCVGHGNLPHFLRFLIWIIVSTTIVLVELSKRVLQYYADRSLPAYLVSKKEMFVVLFLLPIDLFVWVSIIILLGRCLINLMFKGMTQIEVWEKERIEQQFYSERMWSRIRNNYFTLHNKEMPELTSWNRSSRYYEELAQREDELEDSTASPELQEEQITQLMQEEETSLVPKDYTIDDLIFPYDLGVWSNLINSCGYPWMWGFPWGNARENGYNFRKSEDVEEDQLNLPWPPDGGHQEVTSESLDDNINDLVDQETNTVRLEDLAILRRRLDPRLNMTRSQWMNDLGETLDDFGVDVEAEDPEHEILNK